MGYVDPQDVAREREAKAREIQGRQLDVKRAELADRNSSKYGLFKDERRLWLDERVRADLNAAQGHVAPQDLKAAQEARWKELEPVINEIAGEPLSLDVLKEVVTGMRRGHISDERKAELTELLIATRSKVYQTRAGELGKLSAMNADLAKARPKLNALLASTGAGDSVPLARELLAEQQRRPFASLVRK